MPDPRRHGLAVALGRQHDPVDDPAGHDRQARRDADLALRRRPRRAAARRRRRRRCRCACRGPDCPRSRADRARPSRPRAGSGRRRCAATPRPLAQSPNTGCSVKPVSRWPTRSSRQSTCSGAPGSFGSSALASRLRTMRRFQSGRGAMAANSSPPFWACAAPVQPTASAPPPGPPSFDIDDTRIAGNIAT